ncbi:uncharacterized protein LOC141852063 [Brevipalpus obovatus]|uniref:uncharacterized protein LOC141852063 n=1 Tax=Brevipalpus obovatus TaxID=246614 RepID=UPI003D9F5A0C
MTTENGYQRAEDDIVNYGSFLSTSRGGCKDKLSNNMSTDTMPSISQKNHDNSHSRESKHTATGQSLHTIYPTTYLPYYNNNEVPKRWWKQPEVRKNWQPICAAFGLLFAGLISISIGFVIAFNPDEIEFQSYIFFIAGALCFIPGAYYVIIFILAIQGWNGYDLNVLPQFR